MEIAARSVLFTGKFLALVKEGHWEYVERVNATGAVVIVAVTESQKLLLVEQYRIPLHAQSIELPAGMVGDEDGAGDESLAEATHRELLEETGYAAERVEVLITGPSSAGLASELVALVAAFGLRQIHAGGGIGNEKIKVHEVPLEEAHDWLEQKAREGCRIEPKVYAGLYFLLRKGAAL